MAKKLYEEQDIQNLANAIREKSGSTGTMKLSDMATNVEGIPTGGGDLDEYFYINPTSTSSGSSSNYSNGYWTTFVKKLPNMTIKFSGNLGYFFYRYPGYTLPTMSGVTSGNCRYMFANCENLTSINLTGISFKPTNASSLFSGCYNLTTVNLSSFNSSLCTSMSAMFSGCYKLSEIIGFEKFAITNTTTDVSSMFSNCRSLTSLDLTNWNFDGLSGLSNFCSNCIGLEYIRLSIGVNNKMSSMQSSFSSCDNLKHADLRGTYNNKVINTNSLFYGCKKMERIDLDDFDFTNTAITTYTNMFFNCGPSSEPTKIYVMNEACQQWILNLPTSARPSNWSTDNVIIAGSSQDDRTD